MTDDAGPEPVWWGVWVDLLVLLLRLTLTAPYRGLAGLAAVSLTGRDRLAARVYAIRLEELGDPAPDPLPPTEVLRRRFLDRLPDPDGRVRDPDAFAAEGWVALSSRVTALATLAAAAAVLAGAGAAGWVYGRPWAAARVAAAPWPGVAVVVAAAAGVWAVAGWVALGAAAATATWGPARWFADWAVGRADRALWGGDPPPEAARGADPS